MSWPHTSFNHHFDVGDDYYNHHRFSTAPSATSVSASMIQHNIVSRPASVTTPRYQPSSYAPGFSQHQYSPYPDHYTFQNSTDARARTLTEATAGYMATSPSMVSTSSQAGLYLSGAQIPYHPQRGQQSSSDQPEDPYRTQELSPGHTSDASSPESEKTVTAGSKPRCYCLHADCQDENGTPQKSFSRKADVTRHHNSTHMPQFINCPKPNCARRGKHGFTRNDHLLEHLRGYHNMDLPKKDSTTKAKAKHGSGDDEDSKSDPPRRYGLQSGQSRHASSHKSKEHARQSSMQEHQYPQNDLSEIEVPYLDHEALDTRVEAKRSRTVSKRRTGKVTSKPSLKPSKGQSKKSVTKRQGRLSTRMVGLPQLPTPSPAQRDWLEFDISIEHSPQMYTPDTMPYDPGFPPMTSYSP